MWIDTQRPNGPNDKSPLLEAFYVAPMLRRKRRLGGSHSPRSVRAGRLRPPASASALLAVPGIGCGAAPRAGSTSAGRTHRLQRYPSGIRPPVHQADRAPGPTASASAVSAPFRIRDLPIKAAIRLVEARVGRFTVEIYAAGVVKHDQTGELPHTTSSARSCAISPRDIRICCRRAGPSPAGRMARQRATCGWKARSSVGSAPWAAGWRRARALASPSNTGPCTALLSIIGWSRARLLPAGTASRAAGPDRAAGAGPLRDEELAVQGAESVSPTPARGLTALSQLRRQEGVRPALRRAWRADATRAAERVGWRRQLACDEG